MMTDGFFLTKAAFTFGLTTYQCIQRTDAEGTVPETLVECSGASGAVQESITGTAENIHNYDIKITAQDDTTLSTFVEGSEETTFVDLPEGNSSGNISISYATGGKVLSARLAGGVREHYVLSLRIRGLGTKTIGSVT